MERSPRRRAHTKVGPRRVGVPALHPAKSPPRRRRPQTIPAGQVCSLSLAKSPAPPPGDHKFGSKILLPTLLHRKHPPAASCTGFAPCKINASPPGDRQLALNKILLLLFIIEKHPPAGQARSSSLAKGPAKGDHKSGPQKRALPTPERLFLLFWFMPATHLPGNAASRTRHPHPRPCGRRWEKSPASDSSCGRTPSPCPYQSQSTAAHPPY